MKATSDREGGEKGEKNKEICIVLDIRRISSGKQEAGWVAFIYQSRNDMKTQSSFWFPTLRVCTVENMFCIQLFGLLPFEAAPQRRQRPPTPDRRSVSTALASVKSQ